MGVDYPYFHPNFTSAKNLIKYLRSVSDLKFENSQHSYQIMQLTTVYPVFCLIKNYNIFLKNLRNSSKRALNTVMMH